MLTTIVALFSGFVALAANLVGNISLALIGL